MSIYSTLNSVMNSFRASTSIITYKLFNIAKEQNFDFSSNSLNSKIESYAYNVYEYISTKHLCYDCALSRNPISEKHLYGKEPCYTLEKNTYIPVFKGLIIKSFQNYILTKTAINYAILLNDSNYLNSETAYKSLVLGIPKDNTYSSYAQNYINDAIDMTLPEITALPYYKEVPKIVVSQVGGFVLFDHIRCIEGLSVILHESYKSIGNIMLEENNFPIGLTELQKNSYLDEGQG